ncbi:MAG: hypothetical protein EA426_01990 [Spirochaetaceae bacterium]|nr:MAG: hypothetical protein EA426_01990 [Spirochaetaceae bacterium]
MALTGRVDAISVSILLAAGAVEIAHHRFGRSAWAAVVKAIACVVIIAVDPVFGALSISAVLDLAYGVSRLQVGLACAAALTAGAALFVSRDAAPILVLASFSAAALGYTVRSAERSESRNLGAFDRERRARYRLLETQRRLDSTSHELIHATERAERTRIAHMIHDNVGHRLTGILIQLRAAEKLHAREPARAGGMLTTAIEALSGTIELVRETVHDLRPRVDSDAMTIRRIVAEYRFCPVELSLDDEMFIALDEDVRELIIANTRELLTNAARHSRATLIQITITVDPKRVRVVYTDDGIGAATIRDGLGLGGIRSRVVKRGGTITVSGHDGFSVRYIVPHAGAVRTPAGLGNEEHRHD